MNLAVISCWVAGLILLETSEGVAEIIESGQLISLTVTGVPKADGSVINGTYPISKEGDLTVPSVGKFAAEGSSREELEKKLAAAFLEKRGFPQAAFRIVATPGCRVCVGESVVIGGQVKKPGPLPMKKGLTIYQAIQLAGGIDWFGEVKRVKLIRNGEMRIYDLSEERFKAIPLQRNDTIEVSAKRSSDAG